MNQSKKEELKKRLEQERAELLGQMRKEERPENFGDDVDDFTEETDEAEAFSNQVAANQALKDRVSEIDIALSKIASNGFGKCEACGKEIEDAVLEASPESRLCKNCKSKGK